MRFLFLLLCGCSLYSATIEEREFFRGNGYIWIKNFFSDEQVELMRHWAEEIDDASKTLLTLQQSSGLSLPYLIQHIPGVPVVVPEAANPLQVCRAEDFAVCVPRLYDFIRANVTSYVGYFLQEPYVLFKDKINFKWPGGGAFLPHQDFPAYEFLGPREHVTAMITIDEATEENGCLKVAMNWGESQVVLPYIVGGKEHGAIEPAQIARIKWLSLLTSPRDLVLFSSYIPHYSEKNLSQGSRRAMFFTLNRLISGDHRAAYYYAKRNDPNNPIFHIGTPTKANNK